MIQDIEIKFLSNGDKVRYNKLRANIYDDGRFFWAISFDKKYACWGHIVEYEEDIDNENPELVIIDRYEQR